MTQTSLVVILMVESRARLEFRVCSVCYEHLVLARTLFLMPVLAKDGTLLSFSAEIPISLRPKWSLCNACLEAIRNAKHSTLCGCSVCHPPDSGASAGISSIKGN